MRIMNLLGVCTAMQILPMPVVSEFLWRFYSLRSCSLMVFKKLKTASKVWNRILNDCKYFKHNDCVKPFTTGNRRWHRCMKPKQCCKECSVTRCPTKCVLAMDTKKLWTKLFGFHVGDRVTMQGATKILHGEIKGFVTVVDIRGTLTIKEIPSATVYWDTKSPIPRVQTIPLEKLELE